MENDDIVFDNHSPRFEADSVIRLRRLLCVLCALLVVATFLMIRSPYFNHDDEHRRKSGTLAEIALLKTALDLFEIEVGCYPTTAEGLEFLVTNTINDPNWRGPYIEFVPKDRWGHPYIYRFPGPNDPSTFDLLSPGPDGIPGTLDDITKVTAD